MTRRWFSKLITTAPLASKVLAEEGATKTLALPDFTRAAIPPNWNMEGNTLVERSLAKGIRSTPKSPHYQFLEKSLKLHKDNREFGYIMRYPIIRQHDNRVALNGGSSYDVNRKAFALRYNSKDSKWHRDKAVKLFNLRRKTTLAQEWESAKNEIMEACSIEL